MVIVGRKCGTSRRSLLTKVHLSLIIETIKVRNTMWKSNGKMARSQQNLLRKSSLIARYYVPYMHAIIIYWAYLVGDD
jgi:hypothetical protein